MPMKPNMGDGLAMRSPTIEEDREKYVPIIKDFRKEVDSLIQRVTNDNSRYAREDDINPHTYKTREPRDQVRIHLINAKMWAGKILEALDNPFPKELADKA